MALAGGSENPDPALIFPVDFWGVTAVSHTGDSRAGSAPRFLRGWQSSPEGFGR